MISKVYYPLTVVLILLSFTTSCKNRSDSESIVWNGQSSTFHILGEKFNYTLPTDESFWTIADNENLPPNLLFFGIDSNEGVGVGIFTPDMKRIHSKKVNDFTDLDLDILLRQLSSPDHNQTVVYEKIDKRRSEFDGKDSWSFTVEHKILDKTVSQETAGTVYYSGYIFDGLNHPYGVVLISSFNPNDSIGCNQLMKYTSGLSFM